MPEQSKHQLAENGNQERYDIKTAIKRAIFLAADASAFINASSAFFIADVYAGGCAGLSQRRAIRRRWEWIFSET